MSKIQSAAIGMAALLLLILYLFVPTRPKERIQVDKTRALEAEAISPISAEQLLLAAKSTLSASQTKPVLELEKQLDETNDEGQRVELLKSISSEWNKLNSFALGGFYAEQVASITQTDSAWAIAGSTYYSGFQQAKDSLVQGFCLSKAITSFENAVSVNPKNSTHKVNLGLCYVNGGSNPMKGIMMIRGVAEENPEDVLASMTLGKLSMRTGQLEKAIQRFLNVIKFDSTNADAHFWVAQAYRQSNDLGNAKTHFQKCLELTKDENLKGKILDILKGI